jgi:hypothetical protein
MIDTFIYFKICSFILTKELDGQDTNY